MSLSNKRGEEKENKRRSSTTSKSTNPSTNKRRCYEWIGQEEIRDGAKHYQSLKINDTSYHIGDSVFICGKSTNEDFVCQIICLFENLFTDDKELKVQWFFRPKELSKFLKKPSRDKIPKLEEREIIFSDQIELMSVECIFGKANVVCYEDYINTKNICKNDETLFCRWAFINGKIAPYVKPVQPVTKQKTTGTPISTRRKRMCNETLPSNLQTPPFKSPRLDPPLTPKIVLEQNKTPLSTKLNLRKIRSTPSSLSIQITTPTTSSVNSKKQVSSYSSSNNDVIRKRTDRKRKPLTPILENSRTDSRQSTTPTSSKLRRIDAKDVFDLIDDDDDEDISYEDSDWEEEEGKNFNIDSDESLFNSTPSTSSKRGQVSQITTPTSRRGRNTTPTSNKRTLQLTTPTSRRGRNTTPTANKRTMQMTTPTSRHGKTNQSKQHEANMTTPTNKRCLQRTAMTTPSRRLRTRIRDMKLVIPVRARSTSPLKGIKKTFELARTRLHVSSVPDSIICREKEFTSICTFIESKILQKVGGCMYISGVPGSGKTATVYEVSRHLKESVANGELPPFNFIEINGLKLTAPKQAYVSILKQLTGQKASSNKAADLLDEYFSFNNSKRTNSKGSKPVVLLADELDMLYTKKQSILYNLFDWPTRPNSKLIVLAIANTMDLPERVMMKRVISRLGLTRLTFNPYTFNHLQQIVTTRMIGLKVFEPDAILLAARKVASITGDARRALDIYRRATEIAEVRNNGEKGKQLVGMTDIIAAVEEMFSSPLIMAVKNCSLYEKMFLESIIAEFKVTGLEETTLKSINSRLNSLLLSQDYDTVTYPEILSLANKLGSTRLILLESKRFDVHRKVRLNITQDDILFAVKES